jgi:putative transposase
VPAQEEEEGIEAGGQAQGLRQSRDKRHLVRALWTGCQWKAVHRDWFGVSSSVVHERFQSWTRMGIFEKLMKKMVGYYAKERAGIGWRWQSMDSKNCAAPLGGSQTGKNPTDRGKLGAKINLMVDERGAPLSIVLTGANRHDKVSAIDLIVSVLVKRPAHREQHLCADKAYDATHVREFAASEGYTAHISRSTPEEEPDAAPRRKISRKRRALGRRFTPRGGGWWSAPSRG